MSESKNENNKKQLPVLVRKFEIAIYDGDYEEDSNGNGHVNYKPVAYQKPIIVEATSPKDLQDKLATFKACGQIAKVIREIDPPTKEQLQKMLGVEQTQQQSQENKIELQTAQKTETVDTIKMQEITVKKLPIRYYKVGDIDIKDDNGKIYQKQWMRLTETEAANIRIVNDKNNSIVNLNGKHLELKKWILVESSENTDLTIEDSTNE